MQIFCVKCGIIAPGSRRIKHRPSPDYRDWLKRQGWQSVLVGTNEYWKCAACVKEYERKLRTK